jgi:hypothetical protein
VKGRPGRRTSRSLSPITGRPGLFNRRSTGGGRAVPEPACRGFSPRSGRGRFQSMPPTPCRHSDGYSSWSTPCILSFVFIYSTNSAPRQSGGGASAFCFRADRSRHQRPNRPLIPRRTTDMLAASTPRRCTRRPPPVSRLPGEGQEPIHLSNSRCASRGTHPSALPLLPSVFSPAVDKYAGSYVWH